jgi:hypothetical protein
MNLKMRNEESYLFFGFQSSDIGSKNPNTSTGSMLRSTKKQKSNDCHSFEIQERMLQKKKKRNEKEYEKTSWATYLFFKMTVYV